MNRRLFVRRFLAAGAAVSTVSVNAAPSTVDALPDRLTHGPWSLHWTGYQRAQDRDVVVGYWLAHNPAMPEGQQHAYWTSMGKGGYYSEGACFNISWNRVVQFLTGQATLVQLATNRRIAYDSLIAFLDHPELF